MGIVALRRVTVIGRLADKETVLDGLQAIGALHLIPLRAREALQVADPADRHRVRTAFRHLVDAPDLALPYRTDHPFEQNAVVESIMANRLRLRELNDRRDELIARIADLKPWGEFSLPPIESIGGMRLWLYPLPIKHRAALERLQLPWAIVGRGPTTLHVVVIARDEPPADALPVPRIRAGLGPLSRLERDLDNTDIEIDQAQAERKSLTRWRVLLGTVLAAAEDRDELREAAEQTRDEDMIFAVRGWAPTESVPLLKRYSEQHRLALLTEEVGPNDKPPTLLRVPEQLGVATDLTTFYTSPSYRSWDPSFVVFIAFVIFFAMIMADAGYALLIGALTVIYWKKMGASAAGRRFRTLLTAIATVSFAYGVAAGSYFGFAPAEEGLLAQLAVIDVADFEKMMQLSILIGALHITVALCATVWLNRGRGKGLAALGWIAVIAGGLLFWLGAETMRQAAIWMLIGGLVVVVIGAGTARPIEKKGDWLGRVADAFLGLTGVTKLFGDLLSYLRLFALGLASASLAGTFNQLALDIHAARPGIGLLFAALVLLFGHGINLLIGLMSGVVHGLRLNYIEFFGWGLSEEGYPFRAFAKRESPS